MLQQERFTEALRRLDLAVDQTEDRLANAAPAERPTIEARLNEAETLLNKLVPEEARDQAFEDPSSELGIYAMKNAEIAARYRQIYFAERSTNQGQDRGIDHG
ncbi:hypothetical protein [Roseinatronobacter sp. S2]|uniref:hypothetical protein n=1 Tax=Roseinatronobacter sp. S2 TaxID=3035471 RepID=UPI00240F9248|nr:hypothetical protein [Roseinatronobacter sp. S2]WFE74756.1 hypothetical protein P8S53_16430 [Roseinatronobacter sp. S2]